jgi:uncharacterized protein (TIGR00299 family) protein
VPEEDVHFHEVGALDALVDIVGSSAALAALRPERVTASPVPTGSGWVHAEHGALPLPAPAVAEIVREVGAPLYGRGEAELLTPTGASLLGTFVHEFGPLPAMRIDCIGYGAGSADLDRPNVLRTFVGRSARERPAEDAVLVECNLDDMNPEIVPHLIDTLLDAGAHDAWLTPVVMKKGRPALVVSVLTPEELLDRISEIVFEETTTLGLRRSSVTREVLERSWVSIDVGGHAVRVKLGTRDGRIVTASPEHDDAQAAARATGMALRRVYAEALEGVRRASP